VWQSSKSNSSKHGARDHDSHKLQLSHMNKSPRSPHTTHSSLLNSKRFLTTCLGGCDSSHNSRMERTNTAIRPKTYRFSGNDTWQVAGRCPHFHGLRFVNVIIVSDAFGHAASANFFRNDTKLSTDTQQRVLKRTSCNGIPVWWIRVP
jgi:hypothetical protein